MADINRVFRYLENPKTMAPLTACTTLLTAPVSIRKQMMSMTEREIKLAKAKKKASITVKLNSMSDEKLITKLYDAVEAGVVVNCIVRGIFSASFDVSKAKYHVTAISIVDQYLEHARVYMFGNGGKEKMYISSADWMVRNLDHRVEVAVPVQDKNIRQEMKEIINIQLSDNVKARNLNDGLRNEYVQGNPDKKVRSQIAIYQYLLQKTKE